MNRIAFFGLGNPGPKYKGTRHNIGFEWIDSVVDRRFSKLSWGQKYESEYLTVNEGSHEIHFLKPLTYMNESGHALRSFVDKNQGACRIIAVYDDLDLACGQLRYRTQGSDGGHRGLRSLMEHGPNILIERLRIGIGRAPGMEAVEYVLQRFRPDEKEALGEVMKSAEKHFEELLLGEEQANQRLNSWKNPKVKA